MPNQNQIKNLPRLDVDNIEKMFSVYQEDGMYFYNILQTISFPQDLPLFLFDVYTISYGDTWPLISFKTYKTTNLWWIILLANQIENPLLPMAVGKDIKIPNESVVKQVLLQLGKPHGS